MSTLDQIREALPEANANIRLLIRVIKNKFAEYCNCDECQHDGEENNIECQHCRHEAEQMLQIALDQAAREMEGK